MAIVNWAVDADGDWSTKADWNTGVLPGSGDTVVLNSADAHTVTFSTGAAVVASLNAISDALAITGGSLRVAGAASLQAGLAVGGGTLVLAGGGSISGGFTASGGSVAFGNGAVVSVTGAATLADQTSFTGAGTLATAGATTVGGDASSVTMGGGFAWTNRGNASLGGGIQIAGTVTFTNTAGSQFNLTSDAADIIASGGASTFTNSGLLAKTGGTGTSEIDSMLNSTGTIMVNSGTLLLANGGSISGTLGGPGTLQLAATSTTQLGSLAAGSGGGQLLSLGLLKFSGSGTDSASIVQQGGTLGLITGAVMTTTGRLALTRAAIVTGFATLTTAGNTSVGMDASAISLRGSLTWNNRGSVTVGGQILTLNTTTISNASGASFVLTNDGAGIIASGGNSTFTNAGTLTKAAGGGTSEIDSKLNSTGTIAIANGTILLTTGGAIGGILSGPGTLLLASGSTTSLDNLTETGSGAILAQGSLTLAGSAVTLAAGMVVQGGTIGLLTGATLTTTSRLTLTDGALVGGLATLSTAGATTIAGDGSSIGLRGGVTLSNSGGVTLGGQIQTLNLTTFNNLAGGNFSFATDAAGIIASGGNSTFANAGTLAKTGGSGTSEIDSILSSSGTIWVGSGTLLLTANAQLSGLLSGVGTLDLAGSLSHVTALSSTAASNVLLGSGTYTTLAGSALWGDVVASQASIEATASNDTIGGGLTQTGGVLSVDSLITLTLGSNSALLGGLTINGAGTVATTGTTTLGADGLAVTMLHTTLDNVGSLTVDAALAVNGGVEFDNATGAVFGLANDAADIQVLGGNSPFYNAGTLAKLGGSGTSTVDCMMNSTGTITVASGTLDLDGGGALSGVLNGGGTLLLAGGGFSFGLATQVAVSTLSVAGGSVSFADTLAAPTLIMSAGFVTLTAASNSLGSLTMGGASLALSGTAALTVSGAATLLGGGTIIGTGTLVTNGTTTLATSGGGMSLLGGVTWNNAGAVSLGNAITCVGNVAFAINNAAGATFALAADAAGVLDGTGRGSSFVNAGTLTKVAGSGTSFVDSALTSTGTIYVASGTLDLDGGGAISGAIRGNGTLLFGGGDFTVDGATAVSVSALAVSAGSVTFGSNAGLAFGGGLALATGSLYLAGNDVVSVTGPASFTDGSVVDGAATLLTTGAVTVAADGTYASFSDGLTWRSAGIVTVSGGIYTGGAGSTAFINAAGGAFNFATDGAGIFITGSTSTFENDGVLAKTGGTGTSFIYSSVNNVGTLVANSGTLALEFSATLAGTIGGNKGGLLQLASGASSMGQLKITDNGTAASVQLGSGYANWTNTGTVTDAGRVMLGDASNSGPAIFYNASGAVWNLTGNDGSITARGAVILNNAGTIAKVSGTGVAAIGCGLNNSGLIDVASGTLAIQGGVGGTGTLRIEAGSTLEMGAAIPASQTVVFAGPGSTLKLDKAASVPGALQGFGATDKIDLAATTATGATISGNVVTVTAGSASYSFTSTQSLAGLTAQISSDGKGGSLVTLSAASLALASPQFMPAEVSRAAADLVRTPPAASAMRLADLAPSPVSAGGMAQLPAAATLGSSAALGVWPAGVHPTLQLAFAAPH